MAAGGVCVVVGGSGAIGKATAVRLAKEGARVVLVARDPRKLAAAAADVARAAPASKVETATADLALLGSVGELARELDKRLPRIDALVFASGVFPAAREATAEGLERGFVTNYLSQFHLANLLLPKLKASAPSRIVFVASRYGRAALDFDDLQGERRKFSTFAAVAPTKLAQVMLTKELARRLEGTGVAVHACHPGLVKSDITSTLPGPMHAFFRLVSGSPEKGSDTPAWLASSADAAKVSGRFWAGRKELPTPGQPGDAAACARLWTESERLVRQVRG